MSPMPSNMPPMPSPMPPNTSPMPVADRADAVTQAVEAATEEHAHEHPVHRAEAAEVARRRRAGRRGRPASRARGAMPTITLRMSGSAPARTRSASSAQAGTSRCGAARRRVGHVLDREAVARVEEARRAALRQRLARHAGPHAGDGVAAVVEDLGDVLDLLGPRDRGRRRSWPPRRCRAPAGSRRWRPRRAGCPASSRSRSCSSTPRAVTSSKASFLTGSSSDSERASSRLLPVLPAVTATATSPPMTTSRSTSSMAPEYASAERPQGLGTCKSRPPIDPRRCATCSDKRPVGSGAIPSRGLDALGVREDSREPFRPGIRSPT